MKKLLSVLLLIVLAGCGTAPPQQGDDELKSFVPKFEQAAQKVGKTVSVQRLNIRFVDSLEQYGIGIVGKCEVAPNVDPQIDIDRSYWDRASAAEKEVLVFHEMGHCVLGRDHFNLGDPLSGFPVSIMNAVLLKSDLYTNNAKYYTTELFWNQTGGGTNPAIKKTHVCKNRVGTSREMQAGQKESEILGVGSFFKMPPVIGQ